MNERKPTATRRGDLRHNRRKPNTGKRKLVQGGAAGKLRGWKCVPSTPLMDYDFRDFPASEYQLGYMD